MPTLSHPSAHSQTSPPEQDVPRTFQELFTPGTAASAHQSLAFPDVEWLTDGTGGLHLRPFWKAGFVPFALNGRGDAWCFCPVSNPSSQHSPVALCCHDFPFGQIYAPSFAGWLYRRVLDICRGDFGLEEVRLEQWIDVLCPLLPVAWVRTLEAIQQRPVVSTLEKGRLRQALISESEYESLVSRHLKMNGLDQIFEWQKSVEKAAC